ncbi:Glutamate synthase [NADPH] small chain [Frankliniella fusca]|uniref:Glutamate synthase [NADPH] small chain n=1 Tax=Frankliniella fusca TaxID=407009 RepID=A0AAE1I1D6_9NEOP|nr:Glutamate synthase [NADPH] small chain [Frankliniella fusca]
MTENSREFWNYTANSPNCAKAVRDTLQQYEKTLDEVTAFNADSARYMTKCFETLQGLHEELLHVQCWPHKLHHVGNTFQETLPELNATVKHVKKVFLNTGKRKNNYLLFLQEKYPEEKKKWEGFPSPVITRWNSWKKSVNYISEYFDDILEFLQTLTRTDSDDHNFGEEDVTDAGQTSGSIKWLLNLILKEREQIKVFAEFVAVKGEGVEIVIKQLQSKKVPTGHVVYQKLDIIERKFALIISETSGWLKDLPYLSYFPSSKRKEYIVVLQNAAKVCRAALVKFCNTDPAKELFLGLEALLSPKSLGRSQLPPNLVKEQMKKLPFIKKLSCEVFMTGQTALMRMVREEMAKPDFKSLNLVSLLCALKAEHLQFSNACLKALWILPANANSERSISSYNIVVSDKRRKLKPENAEMLTIVYFNPSEYNYNEKGSPLIDKDEDDIEMLHLSRQMSHCYTAV